MGQNFCSFKVKTRDDNIRFCRNPYNVTGRCSRGTCPLANSQYATVIEHEDELYLYIKTAERAHLPRRMWEKVKLDASFPKALEQIDEQLQWWDRRMVHKIKARMLRLKQYLMRKRKAMMEPEVEFVSVGKKEEFKLIRREAKAEKAARIELEIERELIERLRKGEYDGSINYNREAFEKVLDEEDEREEEEEENEEGEEEEFEEDMDDLPEYVMDDEEEEEEEVDEQPPVQKGKRQRRVTIEREIERETPRRMVDQAYDF